MTEHSPKIQETQDKPKYDFIQRDGSDEAVFHCSHPEAKGMFVIQKLTLGRQAELERIKGSAAGPMPTAAGEILAERIATLYVGFEKTSEGFNPEELTDPDLADGLFGEVTRAWRRFRRVAG